MCAVLCAPAHHSPPSYVGGVSILDVDTREDWVQRERREVCGHSGPCPCAVVAVAVMRTVSAVACYVAIQPQYVI